MPFRPATILIFISTLMSVSIFAKVSVDVDFGLKGNTQQILEKSPKEDFETALKDFNATAKKKEFVDSIRNVATANIELKECDNNLTRIYSPGMTLTKNYYSPDGKIVAKKGQRINPLDNTPVGTSMPQIVVIDGTKIKQIEYVGKRCSDGKCVVFITRGNSFDIEEKYGIHTDPIPLPFLNVIGAKCSLSVINAKNKQLEIQEVSLKEEEK